MLLGRSVLTGNGFGADDGMSPSTSFYSFKNNVIYGNGNNLPTALNTTEALQ